MSSRRGGSTLLADVIASNRGVWLAPEPFAVFPAHPAYDLKRKLLPQREHSQYFALSPKEEAQFKHFVALLFSAAIPQLGTCRRTRFPLLTDRVCLKVLNALWMLDWFLDEPDCEVLSLSRHPGSQATSVLRQGWDFSAEAYFRAPENLSGLMTSTEIALGQEILQEGSPWEIAILDWIVGNLPAIRSEDPTLIRVRYEHIVENPEPFTTEILQKRLGLQERERMLQTFGVPSNSSSMSEGSTLNAIAIGDKERLLQGWIDHVSGTDRDRAQRILDAYGITDYSMSNAYPLQASAH